MRDTPAPRAFLPLEEEDKTEHSVQYIMLASLPSGLPLLLRRTFYPSIPRRGPHLLLLHHHPLAFRGPIRHWNEVCSNGTALGPLLFLRLSWNPQHRGWHIVFSRLSHTFFSERHTFFQLAKKYAQNAKTRISKAQQQD